MKLVYIIGPFTAATPWEVEQNVRRAEQAALEIAELGAMPWCPHTNTRFFHGLLTPEFWYQGTLESMRRCDAVVLLGGWHRSDCSQLEKQEAEQRGMPVFHGSHDPRLSVWIQSAHKVERIVEELSHVMELDVARERANNIVQAYMDCSSTLGDSDDVNDIADMLLPKEGCHPGISDRMELDRCSYIILKILRADASSAA